MIPIEMENSNITKLVNDTMIFVVKNTTNMASSFEIDCIILIAGLLVLFSMFRKI